MMNNIGKIKFSWKAILAIIGILGIFAGIIFYLDWAWDTYGLEYALSFASLFVATVVGLAIIYTLKLTKESLEVTRESLKLTRATTRPFLNVVGLVSCHVYPKSIGRIKANIHNKGIYPAEDVSLACEVGLLNGATVTVFPVPAEEQKENPSIYFPDDTVSYAFEKSGIEMNQGAKLEVYITINYRNKLTKGRHKTIRAYTITFSPADRDEILSPNPKKDYWD